MVTIWSRSRSERGVQPSRSEWEVRTPCAHPPLEFCYTRGHPIPDGRPTKKAAPFLRPELLAHLRSQNGGGLIYARPL